MADHLRSMEELLRIPIVGIENAIVVPAVLADEFELKTELLDFGAAGTWLENEPPCSITTWDDLVSKFLNRFFPHSKTRELRKEITNFQQVFDESFTDAWERFKDLLRKSGGNLMSKNTQKALTIIENKAKVRTCRNKPQVSSSGGSSIQNDAITAFTKQVEALISSMQEAYNRNQEAQMGQIAEAFQERPSCVPPSDTETYPREEQKEQEPETITEVVEIPSSQSTPLVPPPETPPLSAPKPKEDLKPNPHQPSIPYPSRLKEENFQSLENPTGCADHFVYRIDIVDSLCDKFSIENNSISGNPTPSSDSVVESPSPSPIPFGDNDSLVEETDTLLSHFNDSSTEYETFCFNIEEKSSGSTTTHSDFSLPEYDSFIFDLSIDPLPPADRSDFYHEEFVDELAHIISSPEYDYFYFDLETDPGEFTTSVVEKNIFDLSSTKDSTSIELNDFPLLLSDCDSSLSKEFSEIDLLVSFPSRNEDIIFDPEIFIIKRVQSKRFYFFPVDDFPTFLFVSDSLLLIDPSKIETFLSFPSRNEDNVFDPGILIIDGIFSFTRKSPHLLNNNFMIDNCHILSEISLKSVSSISFHPKDKEIRGESS
ncbi:hypothetical protein Tco_1177112 [Tanacetum coccineum]